MRTTLNLKFNERKIICTIVILLLLIIVTMIIKYVTFTRYEQYSNDKAIYIDFIIPMNQEEVNQCIEIIPEMKEANFTYSTIWQDRHTLKINIEEDKNYQGINYEIVIQDGKGVLNIKKNYRREIRFQVAPKLLNTELHKAPLKGPIILKFNTPIEKESLIETIEADFDYDLKEGSDATIWHVTPKEPLVVDDLYFIRVKQGLEAVSGAKSEVAIQKEFVIAPPLEIEEIVVEPREKTSIYPHVKVTCNQSIKSFKVFFNGEEGKGRIKDNRLLLVAKTLLAYDSNYEVNIRVESEYGEIKELEPIIIKTEPKSEKLWVHVILSDTQKVFVKEGDRIIKEMDCSGGIKEEPSLIGTYYLRDRGERFFSYRFGEGAHYWVRIKDQYLFHSVPRNKADEIIEEELNKIGKPASHGCIRLKDEDAKWFYDHVPHNTKVIIMD